MEKTREFVGAVLAGVCIGIGGAVYLSVDNKIAGAVLFAVGLYIICTQGLFLFTGKVGYLFEKSPAYLLDLAVIWLGNLAGTGLTAAALRMTRVGEGLAQKAAQLCAVKNGDSPVSIFLLAIFCGMLMYSAVEGYRRTGNPLILFFCVAAFILSGFEHVVADMVYYFLAGEMSGRMLPVLLAATAGNSVGGWLPALFGKIPE